MAQAARCQDAAGQETRREDRPPTAEQNDIAQLKRELELTRRKLTKTEAALEIMRKVHALLEEISESADTEDKSTQH
jgi:hypothetical protein